MSHLLSLAVLSAFPLAIVAAAHPAPGIVVDSKEHIYFVDYTHDCIMTIAPDGSPAIFVDGEKENRFSVPHHLTIDQRDNLYVASDRGGRVWQFNPGGSGSQLYPPLDWSGIDFTGSGGDPFTVDDQGNIYATNSRQNRFSQILRIDPRGLITSLAGSTLGHTDGQGVNAQFGELHHASMVCAPAETGQSAGVLYVSDGHAVRKVLPNGTVSTFVGSTELGSQDGLGQEARFSFITHLSWDAHSNLLVTDQGNRSIRKVTSDGHVSTLPLKQPARKPGEESDPAVLIPTGAAAGPSGDVYILDYPHGDSPRLSRVKPDGESSIIADLSPPRH